MCFAQLFSRSEPQSFGVAVDHLLKSGEGGEASLGHGYVTVLKEVGFWTRESFIVALRLFNFNGKDHLFPTLDFWGHFL